jgi:hypothetical protein
LKGIRDEDSSDRPPVLNRAVPHNIEHALIAAGKDLNHMQPADLDVVEDIHTAGRIATSQLAELAEINSCDEVLDAGIGIGGTARSLADRYCSSVTSIDPTEQYCEQPVGSIDSSAWTTGSPYIKKTSRICPSPRPPNHSRACSSRVGVGADVARPPAAVRCWHPGVR